MKNVPKLMRNLISGRKLDDEHHNVIFNGSIWKITKMATVVDLGRKLELFTSFPIVDIWLYLLIQLLILFYGIVGWDI